VDDASTDQSALIAKEALRQHSRSRLIRLPQNTKFWGAYRIGLKLAEGKYLQIAGSDDILQQNYLYNAVNALEQNPERGLVFAEHAACWWNEAGEMTRRESPKHYLASQLITADPQQAAQVIRNHPLSLYTMVYRRELFLKYKGYQKLFDSYTDIALAAQIILNHGFVYLPLVGSLVMAQAGSLGGMGDPTQVQRKWNAMIEVLAYFDKPEHKEIYQGLQTMNFAGYFGTFSQALGDTQMREHPLISSHYKYLTGA
jgi:glycosyltransferase involved in cell wall biosynthesis